MSSDGTSGLVFDRVSRRFGPRGIWRALDELSLLCEPGRIVCLVGPNGAGKSTALALAAGLLPASGGEIRFAGRPVDPRRPPQRQGYLPQQSSFPRALSVRETLDWSAAARSADASQRDEAIAVGGLAEVLDRATGELSSGWLRRFGVALALLQPSDLVLLDEPFVGLDLDTLERSLQLIEARRDQGAAVVLASHDFDVIDRLSPRLAVLDEGRLLADEAAAEGGSRALYRRTLHQAHGDPPEARSEVASH